MNYQNYADFNNIRNPANLPDFCTLKAIKINIETSNLIVDNIQSETTEPEPEEIRTSKMNKNEKIQFWETLLSPIISAISIVVAFFIFNNQQNYAIKNEEKARAAGLYVYVSPSKDNCDVASSEATDTATENSRWAVCVSNSSNSPFYEVNLRP